MKKPIKLCLFAGVIFTLVISLLSTINVKASEGKMCEVGPFDESLTYSGPMCTCHGETVLSTICLLYFDIQFYCYAIRCDE